MAVRVLNSCFMQVLSPLPTFINSGWARAWADAGGSPLIFIMRCNPQHYYLLHEMGHMLGMPHVVLYKLTEQAVIATVSTSCMCLDPCASSGPSGQNRCPGVGALLCLQEWGPRILAYYVCCRSLQPSFLPLV